MDSIGIYANATATANNVAQIQCPRAGKIKGIQWTLFADLDADLETAFFELSKVPFFQTTTNNTRNLVASFAIGGNLTTSGALVNVVQGFYPLDVSVDAGTILYVNATLTGTTLANLTAILQFS